MGFISEIKDDVVSFTAEKFLNIKFKRFGKMLNFKINSDEKSIYMTTTLKGETEPLTIKINDYEFSENGGSSFIIIKDLDISKEWMNIAAQDFLKGKKFPIPQKLAAILKMLLK